MAGARTPNKQLSSCIMIDSDDTLNSINASSSSIVKYVSQKAGIGINAGKIIAIGIDIRKGEVYHTVCIPFYKYFQTAVKSCSQGSTDMSVVDVGFILTHEIFGHTSTWGAYPLPFPEGPRRSPAAT